MTDRTAEHVDGDFELTSWDENPAQDLEGTVKVATARIAQRITGGIQAETVADMVMTYRPDGTAEYVGHHRVLRRLRGRSGSFVLRANGTFDGTEARTEFEVIPGSGTGELAGIAGSAAAGHDSTGTYSLALHVPERPSQPTIGRDR